MQERLPRSAPDALRYTPGVSVQQTAHGQASPYVRGMTGQQVAHIFDGIRLNNSIYRQGPNQYFFTVDSYTLDHIDVLRGSGSVLWGSDALGGAILALPRELRLDRKAKDVSWHPRVFGQYASADRTLGGRLELGARLGSKTSVLGGGGYRDVSHLRSGGPVGNDGLPAPEVPRFEDDGHTQIGTGFREAAFDGRITHRLSNTLYAVGAVYGYRQYDAPRTDRCPPPEAPRSECLTIKEQFRTLVYGGLRGSAGDAFRQGRFYLVYQRHDEWRQNDRPRSRVRSNWRDQVDTVGVLLRANTRYFSMGSDESLWRLRYGLEAYHDSIHSDAEQLIFSSNRQINFSRGQYLDDSSYLSIGAFADAELLPLPDWNFHIGARTSFIAASAPADPQSGSQAIDQNFPAIVARLGIAWQALPQVNLFANIDQGFRAPNLDDLTSRQQVGPGFQFENSELKAERTITFELGTHLDFEWLRVDAWAFATLLRDAISRAVRTVDDCPPETPACQASRGRFQLVNADDLSLLVGAEGGFTVNLPLDIVWRNTFSYAWGEGPSLGDPNLDADVERVPLSRVPPFNGASELRWRYRPWGIYVGGAVRWALAQRRLAISDLSDPRIPKGGTPGYAVLDLRAGWTLDQVPRLRLSLVFENVFDTPYRVHGSSINGPGRGVLVGAEVGL